MRLGDLRGAWLPPPIRLRSAPCMRRVLGCSKGIHNHVAFRLSMSEGDCLYVSNLRLESRRLGHLFRVLHTHIDQLLRHALRRSALFMSSSSALSHPSSATSDVTFPYLAMSKYGATSYPSLASLLDAGLPSTTNVFHNEQAYVLLDLFVSDQSLFVALRRDAPLPRAATGDDVVTVTLNVSKPPVDIVSLAPGFVNLYSLVAPLLETPSAFDGVSILPLHPSSQWVPLRDALLSPFRPSEPSAVPSLGAPRAFALPPTKRSRDDDAASVESGLASSSSGASLGVTDDIRVGHYYEEYGILAPFHTPGARFEAPCYGRPGPPRTFRSVQTYLDVAKAIAAGMDESFIGHLLTLQPHASAKATDVTSMPMNGSTLASYQREEFDVHLAAFRARVGVDHKFKAALLATGDRRIVLKEQAL